MTYHHGKVKPQGQRKKIEVLNKFVGGNVERGENVFFPSHSIGHQALNLPSPPFFFFSKGGFRSWGTLSFLGHNFQFNLEHLLRQAS
jgi:hypothetical protein